MWSSHFMVKGKETLLTSLVTLHCMHYLTIWHRNFSNLTLPLHALPYLAATTATCNRCWPLHGQMIFRHLTTANSNDRWRGFHRQMKRKQAPHRRRQVSWPASHYDDYDGMTVDHHHHNPTHRHRLTAPMKCPHAMPPSTNVYVRVCPLASLARAFD